jgi:hypothetical protein
MAWRINPWRGLAGRSNGVQQGAGVLSGLRQQAWPHGGEGCMGTTCGGGCGPAGAQHSGIAGAGHKVIVAIRLENGLGKL